MVWALPGLTREGMALLPLAEARFISRVPAAFPDLALLVFSPTTGHCPGNPILKQEPVLARDRNLILLWVLEVQPQISSICPPLIHGLRDTDGHVG